MPHTYRCLNKKEVINDGFPVPYDMNEIKVAQLYNLEKDPKEQKDISQLYPEMVMKISKIADSIRE